MSEETSVTNFASGGILGEDKKTGIDNHVWLRYSHNVGRLYGECVGGIVGNRESTNLFYNNNRWLSTCGASYGFGVQKQDYSKAKPLTAAQMKVQTNFTDWDFTNVWKMDTAKGYPVLRGMPN